MPTVGQTTTDLHRTHMNNCTKIEMKIITLPPTEDLPEGPWVSLFFFLQLKNSQYDSQLSYRLPPRRPISILLIRFNKQMKRRPSFGRDFVCGTRTHFNIQGIINNIHQGQLQCQKTDQSTNHHHHHHHSKPVKYTYVYFLI
jgi:hypothetical protein